MKKVSLAAELRAETGKRATKALRLSGAVPAAVYGPSVGTSRSISVNRRELEKLTHTIGTMLINIELPGEEPIQTLLKAHDIDPVRGHVLHADFYQVAENHLLHTVIPLEVTGSAVGVRAGGVLERIVRDIDIECYPRDLPEQFEVDVTALEIGDSIHASDLEMPSGVRVRTLDPSATLVQVIQPRVIEEPTVAEEGEGEEGEALAEGEEPAEGAAAEGATPAAKDAKD